MLEIFEIEISLADSDKFSLTRRENWLKILGKSSNLLQNIGSHA
jgi:hypothetical protein